jgi:multidrug efflux pump subunit AcrB
VDGAGKVGLPTFLATLSISVVFFPVFLLTGTAKYLFSPLSLSVIISLCASLVLSFTLVPVLFMYLMRSHLAHQGAQAHGTSAPAPVSRPRRNPFSLAHRYFESGFEKFREVYRNVLGWTVDRPWVSVVFGVFLIASLLLFPLLGMDFFPQIDAGQMRLHVRAPPATRIEETQRYFASAEDGNSRARG